MNNNYKHISYISVWNKYLSVIRILAKKSATQEQAFAMNRIDFERAGGTRKSGYKFMVNFINGKPDTLYSGNELVQTFIAALESDEVIHNLLSKNNYTFTFTSKYQLHIKNNSLFTQAELPAQGEEELPAEEEFVAEEEAAIN